MSTECSRPPESGSDSTDTRDDVPGVEVEELGAWAFDTFFGDLPTDLPDDFDR